jgi:hypothetical protein
MFTRKVVLMIALGLTCGSAMAEWTALTFSEQIVVYVDKATIRKSGNMSKIWILIDSKTSGLSIMGKPYLSIKSRNEFDCNEEKSRILSYTYLSKHMGYGEVITTNSNPQEWREIDPESVERDMFNLACDKQ